MSMLTLKYYLEVPASSLDNNKGDIDRISAGLKDVTGTRSIEWPLSTIETASKVVRSSGGKITVTVWPDGDRLNVITTEAGDTTGLNFGVAIDIGTTVVAVELVDLTSGKTIAAEGDVSGQVRYGDDLLTRLHFAGQGGVEELRSALIDTINGLIARVCTDSGVTSTRISAVSAAGNTSMTHTFLGIDPSPIRFEPYTPVINHVPRLSAKELGLDVLPNATVYVFPSVGGYFGGDLISGAVASGISQAEEISLLLDIGTNVEVILGNKDWLLALAGSAGPALEGGVAECARRAAPGAIERVVVDRATLEPSYKSIGESPAYGLCGSGLIDVIAQLYLSGLIDSTGRFILEKKTDRWRTINGRTAYLIAKGDEKNGIPPTYITEKDIQNLLRTKAAMVAALTILLNSVGLQLDDIRRIYTAGSFGINLSVDSATAIGLYPRLPAERFTQLGNGSLLGARKTLLDSSMTAEAERIADKITYLELNVHPEFMEIFRSASYI